MAMIGIRNLTFAYPGSYDNIFEDANLRLDTSWRTGLVGRNGRGKTTLLRLLLGEYHFSGCISAPGTVFRYFPMEPEGGDTQTVLEAASGGQPCWMLERELGKMGMDAGILERPFETLSGGERTKALLAGLFLSEGGFLLLDEPTNHLDAATRQAVAEYLAGKRGFLLVSHDRALLDRCTDHTIAINRTGFDVQKGNFSMWYAQKQAQDAAQHARNEQLRGELRRLDEAARRTAHWAADVEKTKKGSRNGRPKPPDSGYIGHKAAKLMGRAKAAQRRREDAAAEKATLLRDVEESGPLQLHPLAYHSRRLVTLRDVALRCGGRSILKHVALELCRGERIRLDGKNGCGKTSLLKLVLGEFSGETAGEIAISPGLKLSYVPQDASFLAGDLREFARSNGLEEKLFFAILRKLGFERVQFEKDMAGYSAGQKKKTLIAKSLCEQAHLYIWDEPLNYIDVLSRIQIEELLLKCQPAMLFVEHDAAFGEKIATATLGL